jgi:hypothetical protein
MEKTARTPPTASRRGRGDGGEGRDMNKSDADKPSILWRWKGSAGEYREGRVDQEMRYLIKIDGEWDMKKDLDFKGYEERVTG